MNLFENYSLSIVARCININKIGRTKIYIILRALGFVDETNKPSQICIDQGYLNKGNWCYVKRGRVSYITYAIGYKGMNFIRESVLNYLKDHPVPKVERKPKDWNSI